MRKYGISGENGNRHIDVTFGTNDDGDNETDKTLTRTDMDTLSLFGSQQAFSTSALSPSLRVLHVPNTSSCQLATASMPLPVSAADSAAAAAAAADDDDACVSDATDEDDVASTDAELQQ